MKETAIRRAPRPIRATFVAAICALIVLAGTAGRHIAAASPVTCPGPVTVVNGSTGAKTCFTTIQEGVNAANSSTNDTVMVGPGQYRENVVIPSGKNNITVLSSMGSTYSTITGTVTTTTGLNAVVLIQANGVVFGGRGHGFTIQNASPAPVSTATDIRGIAVGGVPGNSDDRVQGNVVQNLVPTNVSIITTGSLATTGRIMGISGTRTPDILIADNQVGPFTDTAASPVNGNLTTFGIQLLSVPGNPTGPLPNSGSVMNNVVRNITENGGVCPGTVLVGIALNDNSANVTASGNTSTRLTSSCRAVGIGSSAVPGPITIYHNGINYLVGNTAAGGSADGLGLKPGANPNFPGSSTITAMTNDIYSLNFAVAVGSQLNADSVISNNNFGSANAGVDNGTGGGGSPNLNATNNYWGCPYGPYGGATCTTILGSQAASTRYQPFLNTPVNTYPV